MQQKTEVRARPALEDLDAIALRYAEDLEDCPASEHGRLREELIRVAMPFAGRLARRYRSRGEPTDDLEQVARLGLVKAVDRFASERGSFTAYAMSTITGELKRHFRDRTWAVRVPRPMQDLYLQVTQATGVLRQQKGRMPTDTELAAYCDVDEEKIAEARVSGAGYRCTSFNLPIGEGGAELGDLFGASDPGIGFTEDRLAVQELISRLPDRERRLLIMRFYGNRSQLEIATELGVSQMHVSRLLSRALSWLREALLSDTEPHWPGEETTRMLTISTVVGAAGAIEVRVAGEVDRDSARELSDAALAAVRRAVPGHTVMLDLGGVPMVDAAGIRALLSVYQAARVREVRVRVIGLQPYVRTVVAAAGLRSMLDPDEA